MCGILVWINKNNGVDPQVLEEAIALQKHRGPDSSNCVFFDDKLNNVVVSKDKKISTKVKLGVAHSRLSIIDLNSRSDQPMLSGNGKELIAFNGEIYNYLELREELIDNGEIHFETQSDTEVLLNWLSRHGSRELNKLNGMWAFAYLNKSAKQINFSRDRYGKKPLLYYADDDNFIASSDYRSIFHILNKKRSINEKYLFAFLMNKKWVNFSSGETFYKDIFSVLPGGELAFDLENFNFTSSRPNSIHKYLGDTCDRDLLFEQLSSSIALRLRSDVPIGILISGGVDSSLISSFVVENGYTNITFYTLADHEQDLLYAREVAQSLKVPLKEVRLDLANGKYEQITSNLLANFEIPINFGLVALPLYIICEQMKKDGVKVLLDGTGGDEVFGGYPGYLRGVELNLLKARRVGAAFQFFHQANLNEKLSGIRLMRRYFLFLVRIVSPNAFVNDTTREYRAKLFLKHLKSDYSEEIGQILEKSDTSKFFSPRDLQIDALDQMLVNYLVITDRTSMAHSIEARSPLLDYRLANYVNLEQSDTFNGGFNKHLLRRIMPKPVSDNVRWRKSKAGFSLVKKVKEYTQSSAAIEQEIRGSKILNEFFELEPLLAEVDGMITNKHLSTIRDNLFAVSQLEKHFEFEY